MNDHGHHIEKDRFQGVFDLLDRCKFAQRTETVALVDANERILAEDVVAKYTLPNSIVSSMDAIAVHFADFKEGMPDTSTWERGREYQFCNTGVGMPEGYDTAIAIEGVSFDDDGKLKLSWGPEFEGENTIEPGTTMHAGDVLIEKGTRLRPAHIGLAAQGGHTELTVVAKPRVSFIPSGNELVAAGSEPPKGKSIECNSYVLDAKLRMWGAEPCITDICPDNWDIIKKTILEQLETCDILVVNAGSSKGSDDLTIEIIEELGEVLNHEFDHGPGRHSSLSVIDGKPVIGIAGPPLGAEFCFDWYVKPFVDAYLGLPFDYPHTIFATLGEDLVMGTRAVNVARRVSLERDDEGYLYANVLSNNVKPALKMCAQADALLVVGKNEEGWRAGETVAVELKYPYSIPS